MPDDDVTDFPPLIWEAPAVAARPGACNEVLTPQQRVDRQLAIICKDHERLGKGIAAIWGSPEYDDYLQQLVFNAADAKRDIRAGFKPEVLAALMRLSELHPTEARPSTR